MKLSDLDYAIPQGLVAHHPAIKTRVACIYSSAVEPSEITFEALLNEFCSGDLLVINNSKVIPARVFTETETETETEILFLRAIEPLRWEVLFPARDFKLGSTLDLPEGLTLTLEQKGLPQVVSLSRAIDFTYFNRYGEVALPPYIQEARGQRHNQSQDRLWYQTQWAEIEGSVAAPTASLHFKQRDLDLLKARGVAITAVTLHVGAGTFLPVRCENLEEHKMHSEWVSIPAQTMQIIEQTKVQGGRVWALGTTVARSLESQAKGLLDLQLDSSYGGATTLFIYPPFEFKIVDCLLTNFHQPRSTLLGLVAAFAGLDKVKKTYTWAIEQRFRFFSYGDLSAWINKK